MATLEALGVPPEIILDSEEPTNLTWIDTSIDFYITCRSLFGDQIAAYSFQTWNPFPTNILSDTAPGALSDAMYAVQFYDEVTSTYLTVLNRAPTHAEYFEATRALAAGVVTLTTLSQNLTLYGAATAGTAVYNATHAQVLTGSSVIVDVASNDETVIAGNLLTTIVCPIMDSLDDFVGYSKALTVVAFQGAGTIQPGWIHEDLVTSGPIQLGDLTDDVTLELSSDETLNLDPTPRLCGSGDRVSRYDHGIVVKHA